MGLIPFALGRIAVSGESFLDAGEVRYLLSSMVGFWDGAFIGNLPVVTTAIFPTGDCRMVNQDHFLGANVRGFLALK